MQLLVECFVIRQGKLHSACKYLQRALAIESKLPTVENAADTHLNMCAVLSQLGKHAKALEHAMAALIALQEELYGLVLRPQASSPASMACTIRAWLGHISSIRIQIEDYGS